MRSKQQNKKSASSGDSLSTNDSKTEIVLQYEPFGAYVPPLFKSPATKEDFLLQNGHLTRVRLLDEMSSENKSNSSTISF